VETVAAEARALGRKAVALSCDVGDRAQVEAAVRAAVEALGPIQILVNNAGIAASARVTETDDALWDQHLRVNLTGAFYASRAVLPAMLAARWGRIVNIASTAARQGFPYVVAYVASKHGLLGLTRALAVEVVGAGVTVNAICPGFVATDPGERPPHPGEDRPLLRGRPEVARRLLAAAPPDRARRSRRPRRRPRLRRLPQHHRPGLEPRRRRQSKLEPSYLGRKDCTEMY
jgi:NAD(P)-dependent dehydrogenase (short-subunit alcohol dehydrogenase family)